MTAVPGPVLVTGLPRSGTSWAGRMLTAGGSLVYVNEPLNPQHPPGRCPGVLAAEVTHRFQYICDDNDDLWLPAFRDTVALRYRWPAELRANRRPYDLARLLRYGTAFAHGRLTGRRALLDDPFAVLSAGWFARRLGCRVIALVREPVSFVASWQRLGWDADLRDLLDQPLLVRDHPEVAALGPALDRALDPVARIAALWRATRAVLARTPGILVVPYESLAADPLAGFRRLYAHAGLPWTPAAERRIRRACTGPARAGGAFRWSGLSRTAYRRMDSRQALADPARGLTPDDAARVRSLTGAPGPATPT
ncbi:sulfotransferase [Actinomadura sp. ATCC 31491]|uniref:Sulfotransferase n=1 Tax=Actinomadura luzonensis TaxID=2805427 RepID=A0ABT0FLN2_9ACTN|nr:sulfotransferase [Actinomadura luzonensis]MCK2213218.1 sulfotransferase [Actinomadura luzonensis]